GEDGRVARPPARPGHPGWIRAARVFLSTAMPIKTKRWCVPAEPDDGVRILVCRYRPRALPKAKETWDVWMRDLGPSPELFDAFQGKGQTPISLSAYRERYIAEMKSGQQETLDRLAE